MRINFTQEAIDKGCIMVDSEKGKEFGLTSDRFTEDSYLWLEGNTLYLSNIISKEEGKGHVLHILQTAKERGLDMACVPVSFRMEYILMRFGFKNKGDEWTYKNDAK